MLTRQDLYNLETYAEMRVQFRDQVMKHKRNRRVTVGSYATLYFEDRLTIQYQIQEMLRIERIFEAVEIQNELDAYNPLIPDGNNWKATFMLEYTDSAERHKALIELRGIEKRVWMQIAGCERIWAIADEDLVRETEEKTSAVHFLRFELDHESKMAVNQGKAICVGIDHPFYQYHISPIPEAIRVALAADIQ